MNKVIYALVASLLMQALAHADETVVVASASAPALTKEQVADVFLGKSKALKPVDLPSNNAARADFYQKVTGHDLSQVKATWARLIFTGQALPPKELPDAGAVKKAIAADSRVIGYIPKSDVDASVRVILTLQ